jgi:uncharacterized protein YdhG (YjbR/CyaY superfamily)
MATVAEYLDQVDPAQRAQFERIREVVRGVVPDADETVSYGMPTFTFHGKYLLYFGAFKNHMSVFPGTIKFTADAPIPAATVEEIVRRRMAEIAQR